MACKKKARLRSAPYGRTEGKRDRSGGKNLHPSGWNLFKPPAFGFISSGLRWSQSKWHTPRTSCHERRFIKSVRSRLICFRFPDCFPPGIKFLSASGIFAHPRMYYGQGISAKLISVVSGTTAQNHDHQNRPSRPATWITTAK